MKNLELKNLGVQELNATEMTTIEGGGLIGNIFTLVGGIATTAGTLVSNTVGYVFAQLATVLGSL